MGTLHDKKKLKKLESIFPLLISRFSVDQTSSFLIGQLKAPDRFSH
jgi:hypothetical protein